jgi:arylformamidase
VRTVRPMRSGKWIDVTVPLGSNLVRWPGDPPLELERISDFSRGDESTFSSIRMGLHTGTHVDAPLHFVHGGDTVIEMPLDVMVGPARVIECFADVISAEEIEAGHIESGERILFKTRNSALWEQGSGFREDFVHLSNEAARELAKRRPRLVGIDYLSVSGYRKNEVEVHRTLLEAGIWIVESLDLSRVEPGWHQLLCLPLKIVAAEGAPARVLVRRAPRVD